MNKLNIYIIYAFAIYPIVGFLTFKTLNVAGHNFMGAFVYLASVLIFISKKEKINIPRYLRFFFLFVVITVLADIINEKTGNILKYIYSNFFLKSFFVLLIIENTIFLKEHIKKIKYGLILILLFAVIVLFVQVLANPTFLVSPSYLAQINDFNFKYRPLSIFSWNGATSFGFSVPAIISILVAENYLNKEKSRNYILFIIGFLLSFLSKSRWFMLSFIVVILQIFIYERGKFIRYSIITLLSVILAFQVMNFFNINYDRIIKERILEENRGGLMEGTAGTRILAFKLFFEFYPEHPIFGTGGIQEEDLIKARASRTSQIHVGLLSLFYYYGAVGGAFYILFLYYLFRRLRYIAKQSGFWGGVFTMLAFVAANLTLVSLDVFKMGVILALVFHKYYEYKYQYLSVEKEHKIKLAEV